MKPIDLEAIRERASTAMPGPWAWDDSQCSGDFLASANGEVVLCDASVSYDDDAEFIANARTDVPSLVEFVDIQTRTLLDLEWAADDFDGGKCPSCRRARRGGYGGHDSHGCAIDSVLTAAGFDTPEKRDAGAGETENEIGSPRAAGRELTTRAIR